MIVILGGNGYVGQAFVRLFSQLGLDYTILSRSQCDYTDRTQLARGIAKWSPDLLINCAGYTGKPNVDACEDHKAECLAGNSVLPGIIAEVCGEHGICWGHVSSGCIFSGRRLDGGGFKETDPPNFCFRTNHCSFYSGTKALGEEALGYAECPGPDGEKEWRHTGEPDAYVWRLRIPFERRHNPRNYISKLITYQRLLEAENSISHLDEFAAACFDCFDKSVPKGIYNVTNPGSVTTRRVVEMICERVQALEQSGKKSPFPKRFDFFADEDTFMKEAARTPRSNCVLDGSKLAGHGIRMTPVEDAVYDVLEHWELA